MSFRFIWIEADTPEELEQVFTWLDEHGDEVTIQKKKSANADNFDERNEKKLIDVFRYGIDTYLDSTNEYTYFIDKLPTSPGVYFLFDSKEQLLYIGSAKNLFKRIPKSFREKNGINNVKFIGYVETDSECDARIFEATMIQKYKPKMNKQIPNIRSEKWRFFDVDGLEMEYVRRSKR